LQNKTRKILLTAIFIVLSCTHQPSDPIKFVSEEIKMSVDSGKVSIYAEYYFKNISNESKSALIFYPFPIDEYHYYPDSILVFGLDYTKNDSGVNLVMRFKPNRMETLQVFYNQKLKGNQARYIITTTKNWKNPLKEARFIIDLPDNFNNPQFSYKPDSVIRNSNRVLYYLCKRNFMPKKDLIVGWK